MGLRQALRRLTTGIRTEPVLWAARIVALTLAVLFLGVLLYQCYRPWWTTERVRSISATRVCTAPPDWREGDDPRFVGCFATDLLDAGPEPHVGDCLRLRLEYESADVREAHRTTCPASP